MYYYVKNLQGDIVKIVKQDGSVAATYTYDAWGKLLSVKDGSNVNVPASKPFHVANLNPYRYRGYIYDTETGLYYLQSRYYDPITGRFVNADDMQNALYYGVFTPNLYTYCGNNPIRNIDKEGKLFGLIIYYAIKVMAVREISKATIALAASVYLNTQGYYVSKKMFLQSLYGGGDGLGPEVIEKIVYLLQEDVGFMNEAKDAINNKAHYGYFNYEFKEGDLHYSIQHCKAFANEVFYNGRRGIRVIICDIYNFDEFRLFDQGVTISNAANDLGYALQLAYMLTPYTFEISFTYYF